MLNYLTKQIQIITEMDLNQYFHYGNDIFLEKYMKQDDNEKRKLLIILYNLIIYNHFDVFYGYAEATDIPDFKLYRKRDKYINQADYILCSFTFSYTLLNIQINTEFKNNNLVLKSDILPLIRYGGGYTWNLQNNTEPTGLQIMELKRLLKLSYNYLNTLNP
jgi:hypothetical protein